MLTGHSPCNLFKMKKSGSKGFIFAGTNTKAPMLLLHGEECLFWLASVLVVRWSLGSFSLQFCTLKLGGWQHFLYSQRGSPSRPLRCKETEVKVMLTSALVCVHCKPKSSAWLNSTSDYVGKFGIKLAYECTLHTCSAGLQINTR